MVPALPALDGSKISIAVVALDRSCNGLYSCYHAAQGHARSWLLNVTNISCDPATIKLDSKKILVPTELFYPNNASLRADDNLDQRIEITPFPVEQNKPKNGGGIQKLAPWIVAGIVGSALLVAGIVFVTMKHRRQRRAVQQNAQYVLTVRYEV